MCFQGLGVDGGGVQAINFGQLLQKHQMPEVVFVTKLSSLVPVLSESLKSLQSFFVDGDLHIGFDELEDHLRV